MPSPAITPMFTVRPTILHPGPIPSLIVDRRDPPARSCGWSSRLAVPRRHTADSSLVSQFSTEFENPVLGGPPRSDGPPPKCRGARDLPAGTAYALTIHPSLGLSRPTVALQVAWPLPRRRPPPARSRRRPPITNPKVG